MRKYLCPFGSHSHGRRKRVSMYLPLEIMLMAE
jgi:hypothetical protein